jgi:hypothetical protein
MAFADRGSCSCNVAHEADRNEPVAAGDKATVYGSRRANLAVAIDAGAR